MNEPFLVPQGFIEDRLKESEMISAEAKWRRERRFSADHPKVLEARVKQAIAKFRAWKLVDKADKAARAAIQERNQADD